MAKIKDIIEFLRLNRRNEEANKNPVNPDYVILESIDSHQEYTVNKHDFEDFDKYVRLVDTLNNYKANYIYILETNTNKTFYIKNSNNKFIDIITHQINNAITENNLQRYDINFGSNFYFYDTSQNSVVISITQLAEIKIFSDTIRYIPNEEPIKNFDNDDYTYNYDNHESISYSILKRIAVAAASRYTPPGIYSSDRIVKLIKSEENGKMFLIPNITHDTLRGKYSLNYQFWKPKQDSEQKTKPFYAPVGDVAMTLEFNYIGAFLSFLNETIFSQPNFNYSSESNAKRGEFKEQFKKIVIEPLESYVLRDTDKYYREIIEIFYYLHEEVASTINPNVIWKLINKAIENDGLTNFSVNEEDIFIKLLETLLSTEGREEKFLSRLNETISVKNTTTVLEYLYDRLNGENGVKFASLVNRAWRKTRFVDYNPEINPEFTITNGPKLLSYQSEKTFGFFSSNASAEFITVPTNKNGGNTRILQINFDTGKYHIVIDPYSKTGERQEEIVEHYKYHPFYPVKLKFTDKDNSQQETAIKLDAIIPAFMLKVNADQQFWHNVIKTGEYAIDIVAIIASYGALSEVVAAEVITSLALIRGIGAAAGITSSVTNLILKLSNAESSELGQAFCEYLFWIEMLSLSGELTVAIKNGLKRSAKKLVEKEEDLAKLEQKLDEAIIEENGKSRKLTQNEKDEIIDELEETIEKRKRSKDGANGGLSEKFSIVKPKVLKYWTQYLEKRGVKFEIGTEEAIEILKEEDALGLHVRKFTRVETNEFQQTIYLYGNPSTSTFLEECYHAVQTLERVPRRMESITVRGKTYYNVDAWEYLAKRRILDEAETNGITYEEFIFIENQIQEVLDGIY